MDFRPAYQALAERFAEDLQGVKVTRKNLSAEYFKKLNQLPALVIVENGDDPIPDEGQPVAYMAHAALALHTRISGDDEVPGDSLLELRKRVEDALTWRVGEPRAEDGYWTTLGGVVRSARLGPVAPQDDDKDAELVSMMFQVSMIVTPSA